MADIVRKQIRDAVTAALKVPGLATTGSRVFENRNHVMQDTDLPGLRVYAGDETIERVTLGSVGRRREHSLDLIVECCSKKSSGMDDELDAMVKEVITLLDANQGLGGAKCIEPTNVSIEMDGEAERDIGVARISFSVPYYTAQGAPDVAL